MNYLTCEFGGQLGNLLLEMYTCFQICKSNGLSFNRIIFNNTPYTSGGMNPKAYNKLVPDNLINENSIVFSNIESHFVSNSFFNTIKFNDIRIDRKNILDLTNTLDNIRLKKFSWHDPQTNDEKMLFYELFHNDDIVYKLHNAYEKYLNDNVCAIHIRRGDFIEFRNGKYLETIDQIHSKMNNELVKNPNTQFFVFSNDIEWCKTTISTKYNIHFHSCKKTYEDLYLMSLFNRILFNPVSTYSFCAMLLNPNLTISQCGIRPNGI